MKVPSSLAAVAAASISLLEGVQAHTFIHSVYVNGVDQGTFNGIRVPGYVGGPPNGAANHPVKDLESMDMRCSRMGDQQVPYTIQVRPGDNITMEWRHAARRAGDRIINGAPAHKGPVMVYLTPDPPTNNSFVKIWEQGKISQSPTPGPGPKGTGRWAMSDEILDKRGLLDARIPKDLKAGFYLLRAELIALHLADASWKEDKHRGAEFYIDCLQLEVLGDGEVELPEGVGFPGAYDWKDPGILYDVFCSVEDPLPTPVPCPTTYQIPGPPVWTGAWPETTQVKVGEMKGPINATSWDTWIIDSVVTSASAGRVLGSATYQQQWSTTYHTPMPTPMPTS
ncbi:glycosyl hydrolase family 61-domain-containing protein [Annulohypoxylon maeteangense]|uniref:glycosyl hydrolase family 61-domain-containing protein n=1 Tax=Annulohypoxylon maeteangense TaxID=1927788 RepID=UPI002008C358|nr:glycosyl hydrolase family 61-domain-containing protein [Annulohypoxylon maeteangense]KAI0886624.1 glycosyl hydrolase family 61-domain-containing protein [Annulohypoxylon maeteangense]